MIDLIGLASSVAGLFGISAKEFLPKVREHFQQARESRFKQKRDSVRHHMLIEVLGSYYQSSLRSEGSSDGLHRYSVNVARGGCVETSIIVREDWVGISCDLENLRCLLAKGLWDTAASFETGASRVACSALPQGLGIWEPSIDPGRIARYAAMLASSGGDIWDQEIYRLAQIEGLPSRPSATFVLDSFIRYRLGVGFLMEELTCALIDADLDVEHVIRNREALLPLRGYFLPGVRQLGDLQSRVCAGGVEVTLAIARPEDDFVIPVQQRSSRTGEGQGLWSIVPMAFHQPIVDPEFEVHVRSCVLRELYEELFGGDEAGRDVRRLKPDWYLELSQPLCWLEDHRESFQLICTAFTFNLLAGQYDFSILMVVSDPHFWRAFGSQMISNWEAKGTRLIYSKDLSKLNRLVVDHPWASQGLVSLMECLTQLKALEPDRVSDPKFQRLLHQ